MSRLLRKKRDKITKQYISFPCLTVKHLGICIVHLLAEHIHFFAFSVNRICYDDYSATLNSLIVPVSEEKSVLMMKNQLHNHINFILVENQMVTMKFPYEVPFYAASA